MSPSRRPFPLIWLLVALLLVALVAPVLAAESAATESTEAVEAASPEKARRARVISRTTMSPFCPGRTLADCPSPNAAEWRHDIQKWVNEGLSAYEIKQRLDQRAGQDLSGAPSTSLGWTLPLILALAAAFVLYWVLRKLRGRAGAPDDESTGKAQQSRNKRRDEAAREPPEDADVVAARALDENEDDIESRLRRELEGERVPGRDPVRPSE